MGHVERREPEEGREAAGAEEVIVGLVCCHIALEGAPFLVIAHQEPEDAEDSGLSLSCGEPHHEDAQWLVDDLQERLAELPRPEQGQAAIRQAAAEPWTVETLLPAAAA